MTKIKKRKKRKKIKNEALKKQCSFDDETRSTIRKY